LSVTLTCVNDGKGCLLAEKRPADYALTGGEENSQFPFFPMIHGVQILGPGGGGKMWKQSSLSLLLDHVDWNFV